MLKEVVLLRELGLNLEYIIVLEKVTVKFWNPNNAHVIVFQEWANSQLNIYTYNGWI